MTTHLSAPGSTAAYDDLIEAYEAWRNADDASTLEAQDRLTACAVNCGMAADEAAPVAWIRRWITTYRTYRGEVAASMQTLEPVFATIFASRIPRVRF